MKIDVKIIKEFLLENPEIGSRTAASALMALHPSIFIKYTNVYHKIRYYRGEMKGKSCPDPVAVRSDEQKLEAMGWNSKLPSSDYEELETFHIPKGCRRLLIMSDIHLPYHDEEALSAAIAYGIKHKADAVLLNGDTIDMYMASRFIKDPRLRDLAGELEMTRQLLETLNEAIPGPIYFKLGNHEDRWENYLKVTAPELLGITDFKLENILRFGQYGAHLIKSRQKIMFGDLSIMHGHEFGNSVFSPVNPARGLFMKAKATCVIGHHHQTSEHSEKDMHGNVITTFSTGCLCGLSPEYLPYNKWNLGWMFVERDEEGEVQVRNLRYVDGKVK
jgi:predicted phosphodiesterase